MNSFWTSRTLILTAIVVPILRCHCSIHEAVKCLRKVESNVLYSAQTVQWKKERLSFISSVEQINDTSELDKLFDHLMEFEANVKSSMLTTSWKQWRSKYWMHMVTSNLKVSGRTVTGFITALKYLEENILPEALTHHWLDHRRKMWLSECDAEIEPLLQLSLFDDMYADVASLLKVFGYNSLKEYDDEATKVISALTITARKLAKSSHVSGALETTAGSFRIVSGILSVLGIILAPITAGASLVVSGTSIAFGIGSAATGLASSVYNLENDDLKRAAELTNAITGETLALLKTQESFACSLEDVAKKLKALEQWEVIDYLKSIFVFNGKTIHGMQEIRKTIRLIKILREFGPQIKSQADMAFAVAAPGLKVPGKLRRILSKSTPSVLIKTATSLSSNAVRFNVFTSVLSVGFGIWDIIRGVEKIEDSRRIANDFKKFAADLSSAKHNILLAYNVDDEQDFVEDHLGTLSDEEGRIEEWHRACFHGNWCITLVLLSEEVNVTESERICQRNGLDLLTVGSKMESDTVRGWLLEFGKSTWISANSSFIDYAPSLPVNENQPCVFFSADEFYMAVNGDCGNVQVPAVACA